MRINENKLDSMLRLMGNKTARFIMDLLDEKNGIVYTDLLKEVARNDSEFRKDSGRFAYYVKRLKQLNAITIDRRTKLYYLTRIGVELQDTVNRFKLRCVEYDISDLGKDGYPKVTVKIVGRKLIKE